MRLIPLGELLSEELQRYDIHVVRAPIPAALPARAMLVAFEAAAPPMIVLDEGITDRPRLYWMTAHELMHVCIKASRVNQLSLSVEIADALERMVRLQTALFCLRLDRFVAALVSGCSSDIETASRLDVPVDAYREGVQALRQVYGMRTLAVGDRLLTLVPACALENGGWNDEKNNCPVPHCRACGYGCWLLERAE